MWWEQDEGGGEGKGVSQDWAQTGAFYHSVKEMLQVHCLALLPAVIHGAVHVQTVLGRREPDVLCSNDHEQEPAAWAADRCQD